MSRALFLRIFLASLSVAVLAACGGKALGSEAAGKAGFRAAEGPANYQDIAPEDRNRKPEFAGETIGGDRLSIADLRGSVSVVNFWASWCGPCRKEEANLQALWKEYGPKGVLFVGVNTRDTKADARAFMEEFGVTYPAVYDPYSRIAHKFRVVFLPVTYVLDRQGRVATIVIGAIENAGDMRRVLDRELAG